MYKFLVLVVIVLTTVSCKMNSVDNTDIAAQYKDNILTWNDVKAELPSDLNKEDSIKLTKKIVYQWVTRQILYEKSLENIGDKEAQFERKVKAFKQDIYIHEYKTQLAKQKIDTVVSNEEIQKYYEKHKNEFVLREPIVKYYFVKFPISIPKEASINNWFYNATETNINKIKEYAYQNARYYEFDNKWESFDKIYSLVPSIKKTAKEFIRSYKVYHKKDSLFHYFIRINDYLLPGEITPLEYMYAQLKQIIISKRKITFFNSLENQLQQEALSNKQIKINT